MSTIKVNKIEKRSGSTLTLGGPGTAVTLACGATQTGFGRTGTVDWQTGSIKTTTFTAANGEGYFADTSSGGFTMNLPAGTAGNIVSVVDYTNTFDSNGLTISANGTQKIGGVAADITLNTVGQSVTFVYVDDTEGWKNVQDSTSNVTGNAFMAATGGTITTSGNDKIHTFTSSGNFVVSKVACSAANNEVSYVVIAGGGAGSSGLGSNAGGGGGAGGYRETKSPATPYTASPLDGQPSAPNRITVTAATFPITVGGGGAAQPASGGRGANGSPSTFSTITSAGGGAGGAGSRTPGPRDGANGGSGGGKAGSDVPGSLSVAGTGNTPPVSPPQGQPGGGGTSTPGTSGDKEGFGGGGATEAGQVGESAAGESGRGGIGATSSIDGTPTQRSGGGAGGAGAGGTSAAATGGGGTGSFGACVNNGNAGTANTGGGGGGGANGAASNGNSGGSGVVIIRYKFQ
jgi:hypothetical protein